MQEKLNDNQIYLGINPLELHILDEFADPLAQPSQGFYTDWSGVKTRLSYFGLPSGTLDSSVGSIPFPDDGVHAEAIEYLAAIKAVKAAKGTFTAVELGAGYGPWLAFSAKSAQKRGMGNIRLVAVEADLDRHALLRTHLADNSLPEPLEPGRDSRESVSTTVYHGAISDSNGTLSFGSKNIHDWGAAPITDGGTIDYRGCNVNARTVNAYTIDYVIRNLDTVDFMHIDIQGFEYKSIKASIEAIRKKVRFLLIATHSRKIEGNLFDLLYDRGWHVLYEKPCKFHTTNGGSLEAHTYVDGTQVWVNTDLVAREDYVVDEQAIRLRVAEYRSWALENVIKEKDHLVWKLEADNTALRDELTRLQKSPLNRIVRRLLQK
ncbi:FkbM family methyltransferase [Paraburkholderia atlantica]|uniref:FkbM family methyltransferase n=1 Tax=Paraburkholderia atlantica TaxID=2654982 RepID=UPI00187B77A3|nr:FkbM family methyltransferase [Paraburkholderia atlantica]